METGMPDWGDLDKDEASGVFYKRAEELRVEADKHRSPEASILSCIMWSVGVLMSIIMPIRDRLDQQGKFMWYVDDGNVLAWLPGCQVKSWFVTDEPPAHNTNCLVLGDGS